ncbi:MAG: SCO family protein [Deltaproteobacteria bacterium]
MSHTPENHRTTAQRLAGSPWSWVALVLVVIGGVFASTFHRAAPRAVPALWTLPDWALVDQDGHPFGARDLRGRVYIANFVFTSCVLECPRLTHEMSHLAPQVARYGERVHLVSLSVDPSHDGPEQLRGYMARYHADPRRWTFVTGPEEQVLAAITGGFRVGVEIPARGPDGSFNPAELAHTNRFALVDTRGRLRGTYLAEPDGIQQLIDDLAVVVAER